MNFRDLKLRIQQFCPDLNLLSIGFQINKAYQRILNYWPWSFLLSEGVLTTYNKYDIGTVSVTQGSKAVVGTGTGWTSDLVGRYFRVSSEYTYYEIESVTDATNLTLKYAYGADTKSGKSYTIFQHIYSMPSDVREIAEFSYNWYMRQKDQYYLNRYDPWRFGTGTPEWWSYRGKDANGNLLIEFYPVPLENYPLTYKYYKKVPDLSADTDTPLCRSDLLEQVALCDCYKMVIYKNDAYRVAYEQTRMDSLLLLQEAIEEDYRTRSQRPGVWDVYEPISRSDDFWVKHEPTVY